MYMMGNVEDAVNLCNTFILDYPESIWTPEVLFWLAEQAFNTGEFIESENSFYGYIKIILIIAYLKKHYIRQDGLL